MIAFDQSVATQNVLECSKSFVVTVRIDLVPDFKNRDFASVLLWIREILIKLQAPCVCRAVNFDEIAQLCFCRYLATPIYHQVGYWHFS